MKRRLYDLVRWSSQKAVNDMSRVQFGLAWVGAKLLLAIDKERIEHEAAAKEQQQDLHELKLLGATLEIKKDAIRSGGFAEEHGPALALAANALYEQCMWEDEDITEWFGALVLNEDGENMGADITLEDEEEE